jgi:hypothetical protein
LSCPETFFCPRNAEISALPSGPGWSNASARCPNDSGCDSGCPASGTARPLEAPSTPSATICALNVTIRKSCRCSKVGAAAPCFLHIAITRFVPRPQTSTAPVRWKAAAVKNFADVAARVRGNPVLLNRQFPGPQDFLAVQILQCQLFCGKVFPPSFRVTALKQQLFVP